MIELLLLDLVVIVPTAATGQILALVAASVAGVAEGTLVTPGRTVVGQPSPGPASDA